mgnify:CR=1 FL=1
MQEVSKARAADLINPAQEMLFRCYENGEFAFLLEISDPLLFDAQVASCGDGLLVFLARELDTNEGVSCIQDAFSRVDKAISQLQAVESALAQHDNPFEPW